MSTSDVSTSDVPTSDVPTSDVPTSDVSTSDVPTSDVSTSDVPTSDVPTSDVTSRSINEAMLELRQVINELQLQKLDDSSSPTSVRDLRDLLDPLRGPSQLAKLVYSLTAPPASVEHVTASAVGVGYVSLLFWVASVYAVTNPPPLPNSTTVLAFALGIFFVNLVLCAQWYRLANASFEASHRAANAGKTTSLHPLAMSLTVLAWTLSSLALLGWLAGSFYLSTRW
ncbi:hypothetical protein OAX78_02310 [Planctomycetota bacterium]|nr:hypothetical protein [Planctomycetota bacterium]